MINYSEKRILCIIFVSAFTLKFLSSLFLLNIYGGPETFEYETIANNILNGEGFLYNFYGVDYKAFIQPFYPVLTAIIYHLTNHSQFAILVIESIVSSSLCFIIYYIAIRLTGTREALLAAVLTAFHPGLAVYSTLKLHSLVFDVFFYLLTIILILRFIRTPNSKNAIVAGSVIGLTLLSRTTILAFVIFALTYVFFKSESIDIKAKLRYVFLICLFAAIVYSPWVIRNYKVFNGFVFMQTISGENLWAGNNKEASGSTILMSGKSIHTKMPYKMREDLRNLDELGQARYYKDYFLNFIKDEPLLFMKLFMRKFYYFWWFAPHTGVLYSKVWLYIYKLYYGILFFLFVVGSISALRKSSNSHVLLLLFIYMFSLAFLHAIVNVDTRHRWTIEPVMIIFSSIGFFNVVNYLRDKLKLRPC